MATTVGRVFGQPPVGSVALTGNANDWQPWSGDQYPLVVRLSSDGNYDITGIVPDLQGAGAAPASRFLHVINIDATYTLTVKHESASSTAANRIYTFDSGDLALAPNCAMMLVYDSTTSRWRVLNAYYFAGAGGGDAYRSWHSTVDIAPSETLEVQIQPPAAASTVKMWLHGRAWHGGTAGAIDAHTHTGNNAHTHTGPSHAHTFSDSFTTTTDPGHTHAGPNHRHTGPSHTHSFSDTSTSAGGHSHTTTIHQDIPASINNRFVTVDSGGSYYVAHTSNTESSHTHYVSGTTGSGGTGYTGYESGTTGSGGSHSHTGSVSGNTGYAGTGSTGSTGSGLSTVGVATTDFPQTVQIWIDGTDRTAALGGPWGSGSADFDTGELDITAYCTGVSHKVEIVEAGGTGGRIQYSIHANG